MTPQNAKSRVYGEPVDINENASKEFWNNRAEKYNETAPFVSVNLGDGNPERAARWDEYEKTHTLPLLNIHKNDTVLDIGCGVGRLSDILIPQCKYYLGADYAEDLIAVAKKRAARLSGDYAFYVLPIQSISAEAFDFTANGGKFSVIIMAGVLFYLNDDNVTKGINAVLSVAAPNCRIYIQNSVAVNERLTLNAFYSDELKADYSAVYRSAKEYEKLFAPLTENGFSLTHSADIQIETADNSETKRVYQIYGR